jgi:hypothetical protein
MSHQNTMEMADSTVLKRNKTITRYTPDNPIISAPRAIKRSSSMKINKMIEDAQVLDGEPAERRREEESFQEMDELIANMIK